MPQSHRNQHRPERRAQERQDRDARGCGDRPYSPAAGQQAEIRPHHRGEHEQQIATPGALAPRRSDQGVPREQRDSGEDEPDPGKHHRAGTLSQHEKAEQDRHDGNESRRDDGVVERRRERGPADQDEGVGRADQQGQHQRPPPAELADEDRPDAKRDRKQHQARHDETQDRDVGSAEAVDHRSPRDHRLHAPDQRAKDAKREPLPEGAAARFDRDCVSQGRLPFGAGRQPCRECQGPRASSSTESRTCRDGRARSAPLRLR